MNLSPLHGSRSQVLWGLILVPCHALVTSTQAPCFEATPPPLCSDQLPTKGRTSSAQRNHPGVGGTSVCQELLCGNIRTTKQEKFHLSSRKLHTNPYLAEPPDP